MIIYESNHSSTIALVPKPSAGDQSSVKSVLITYESVMNLGTHSLVNSYHPIKSIVIHNNKLYQFKLGFSTAGEPILLTNEGWIFNLKSGYFYRSVLGFEEAPKDFYVKVVTNENI